MDLYDEMENANGVWLIKHNCVRLDLGRHGIRYRCPGIARLLSEREALEMAETERKKEAQQGGE